MVINCFCNYYYYYYYYYYTFFQLAYSYLRDFTLVTNFKIYVLFPGLRGNNNLFY